MRERKETRSASVEPPKRSEQVGEILRQAASGLKTLLSADPLERCRAFPENTSQKRTDSRASTAAQVCGSRCQPERNLKRDADQGSSDLIWRVPTPMKVPTHNMNVPATPTRIPEPVCD